MRKENSISSVLKMERMVFDKIEFNRLGFKNDNEIEFEFQSGVSQGQDGNIYKVNLVVKGNKKDEFIMEISITGFFSFDVHDKIEESLKNNLLTKNAIAILMPYLRSEVTLLTAQPEVECVVLPVFNINNMISREDIL